MTLSKDNFWCSALIVEFIIIHDLLYLCIIGLSFLNRLQKWGIQNTNQTPFLNQSVVKVSHDPLIKILYPLQPIRNLWSALEKSLNVSVIASGSALNSLRPITDLSSWTQAIRRSLRIGSLPNLQAISHQHACTEVLVINHSPLSKTIGKETKIANATWVFEEITSESFDNVNSISSSSEQSSLTV